MRRAPIGVFLALMVSAVALPLLLFVSLLLAQLEQNEREALERRTAREAQSIASIIEQMLHEMDTTLHVVATAPELASGNLQEFHARTSAALLYEDLYVLLVDRNGQQLLNTRVAYGTELGKTSNLAALASALDLRKVIVSDIFLGRTSGVRVFNVLLPLPEEHGSGGAALIMTRDASILRQFLESKGLWDGWSAALIDGAGNVITEKTIAGQGGESVLTPEILAQAGGVRGVVSGVIDGKESTLGYARVGDWSWKVVVWGPVATAQQSILDTWLLLLIGGLVLLALSFAIVVYMSARLKSAVTQLAVMADAMAEGEKIAPIRTPVSEIDDVSIALSTASVERSEAEARIRLILRELTHRTKNLLTVIQAVIRQTAGRSRSVDELTSNVTDRIQALSRSVDLLVAQAGHKVPLSGLIDTHLSSFIAKDENLVKEGPDLQLSPDAVQNLGLVLHELATNSTKYGALSVPEGRLKVIWSVTEDGDGTARFEFNWIEVGGPPAVEPEEKGFGSEIIERVAPAAFRGDVTMEFGEKGFRYSLHGPLDAFCDQQADGS